MRKSFLICLFICSTFVAHADNASKQAKVKEYFRLAKIDQLSAQTMDTAAKQVNAAMLSNMMGVTLTPEQQKQADSVQAQVMQLLQKTIGWQVLEPEYVKIFAAAYTDEELDTLVAFYRSPAGQAVVERTPVLMQQANAIVMSHMQAVMPQLQQIMKENMGQPSKPAPK